MSETKDETIEPSLAESRSRDDEWRQRYFEARDALFQFKYPPDPRLLREIADEIDCGSDCEHGNTEWDTNAHVCSRSERKEGCAGEKASCLRQFADAIGIRSAAVDQTGGVTSPDYVMVPKQELWSIIYDIENGFTETAMKQLEKLLSAAPPYEGSGMTPSKLEGFSAALRAQVIEECAKVVENFSQIGMWEAARTRVCIAKAIRSLSAVSASDVGEPVAWRSWKALVAHWGRSGIYRDAMPDEAADMLINGVRTITIVENSGSINSGINPDLAKLIADAHNRDVMLSAAAPSPRSDEGEGNKTKCPTCFGLGGYGLSNDGGPAERCYTCEGFGTVAAPPASDETVAWRWKWNDGQTWMLSESEPDDDGLRVIEPLYLRPSPTRDETIEMCAKWHDEQAAQYDVKRQEWIERGLILAADKCDDLSDNHRRHAASIRSLKSTPDAEGE